MGLPVEVNNLMLGSLGGYTVGRSLRFRSSATAYLNRTPASAGNQQKWTWSGWVKRGALSYVHPFLFSCYQDDNNRTVIGWYNSDQFAVYNIDAASVNLNLVTTAVYRDPSAWYHIVVAIDTTQATSSNRAIIYINGQQVTALSTATYPSQNTSLYMNSARQHRIASSPESSPKYFDGYLAEVNFIDGQQLTPSSFGAYDTNGVWQPKKYTGTYGTNGFYLPFSNTTSTTTLVQDSSGNGNNWTPNNISLTAGTTYDSMIDSPTNAAGSSTGIGNYAVLNPLYSAGGGTFSNGNLQVATGTSTAGRAIATMGVSSGKWYWEITPTSIPANVVSIGFVPNPTTNDSGTVGNNASEYGYLSDGQKFSGGSAGAYGASYVANDVIGVALDLDAGTLVFYKNGTSQGTAYSSIPLTNTYVPAVSDSSSSNSGTFVANFGQRPFSYTPPSGYKALNTYNLPAPSIANGAQYMAATLYTGNGGTQSISNAVNGVSFQPDFVWMKSRNNTYSHLLFDSVRGGTKRLISNLTDAEATVSGGVNSFDSNGMTIQNDASLANLNASGTTYVGWQWKGGGTGVTNTSGTITSTVSASPSSGFSIATYTGTGANATVGHGLGVAPNLIFVKRRSGTAVDWLVYSSSVALNGSSWLVLNTTAAATAGSTQFNSTAPTSSVFSVGTDIGTNASAATYVAYCFSAVSGYSAFGKYTGNGSADGPFIYTGFRPRWVMIKNTQDGTTNWYIYDTSRDTYNIMSNYLMSNLSNAEASFSAMDYLSNGFKIRTSNLNFNNSGQTHIYAAFAESPFQISRAR